MTVVTSDRTFLTPKSQHTFERVLADATRLFVKKGFHETTMRDISKETKLGLGALYYYCRSKEELVLLFYDRKSAEILALFNETPSKYKSLPDAFAAFMQHKIKLLEPYRPLLIVVFKESIDPESSISPLNNASSNTRDKSIKFFNDLIQSYSKPLHTNLPKSGTLLWMLHLAVLAFWLYDRSPEFKSTGKLMDVLVLLINWFGTLNAVPGFSQIASQLTSCLTDMIR